MSWRLALITLYNLTTERRSKPLKTRNHESACRGKARSYLVLNKRSAVETLPFNVEIAGPRPATSEELERGHAHEAGHEH
jgi:hypothetical protein